MSQIKNLTHTVEAWEVGGSLRQVQEKLEECLDLLQKTAPKEDGIILEAPLLKSTMKKNSRRMKKKKVDYKRLPVSQKKNPFTGRVGERANNMKRGYNVSLNDIERQPAKQPKLAHIKNANSSAEAQVNINRSVNVNNSNGSNSNANQTVKASTPYTPNTTTCKWINRELIRKRGTAFSRFRQWRLCQDRVGIMGKQIADLEGKLKTLNFCLKKTEDLKDKVSVEALVTAVVKF